MKFRRPFAFVPLLCSFAVVSMLAPRLCAQTTLHWNASDEYWSFSDYAWNSELNGNESSNVPWTNGNHAVFTSTPANAIATVDSEGITVGNITFSSSSIFIEGEEALTLGPTSTFSSTVTASPDIRVVLTGESATLTKTGLGNVSLAQANTYTGGTTIAAGTLTLRSSGTLGSGAITLSGGTLLSSSNRTLANLVNITAASTISSTSGTLTLTGALSGSGQLTKAGNNTLVLPANPDLDGGITLAAGTLTAGSSTSFGTGTLTITGGTLSTTSTGLTLANPIALNGGVIIGGSSGYVTTFSGNVTVGSVRSVTVSSGVTAEFSGVISGAGSLLKFGTGTLLLSAHNTNTGAISLNAGTLRVGHNSALGTGTVTFNNATLEASGAARAIANPITFSTGITLGGSLDLTLSGATNLGAITRTLTVTNTALTTFAGIISGSGGITKAGTGTLLLSAANAYTGATTVNAGLLSVNGSLHSSSAVTVNTGATLGGTGTIGGATTIALGGTLAPGNSAGVLTFSNDLSLAAGSATTFEINGATRGGSYDGINAGGLTYGGTLNLIFGSTIATGGIFDLFQFTSSGGDFNAVTGAGSYTGSFDYDNGVWTLIDGGQTLSFSQTTGDLSISASAIPEPSTYAALFGGLVLTFAAYRRHRKVSLDVTRNG